MPDASDLPPNGTEQRLDTLIDEIKGLRADLAPERRAVPPDGQVELREPAKTAADYPELTRHDRQPPKQGQHS